MGRPDRPLAADVLRTDPEDYVERVLELVERVPRGRVTTYGAIAAHLADPRRRGPRSVGRVMSQHGGGVPWWRVVRADGSLPASHREEARAAYLEEGTPLRPSGRIDMPWAYWDPDERDGAGRAGRAGQGTGSR